METCWLFCVGVRKACTDAHGIYFVVAQGMESDYRCTFCWKSATSLCGRCKLVRYCGAGCQKGDWKTHKVFCGADAYPAKNQTAKSYRVLFFPVDEGKARFIEVSFESHWGSQQEPEATVPSVDALLGNGGTRSLTRAGIGNEERELVNSQLSLHLRSDSEWRDDTPPNLSLRKFMGLGVKYDLRGPIVISKRKKTSGGRGTEHEHMDMEVDDLTLAVTQKEAMSKYTMLDLLKASAEPEKRFIPPVREFH